jgi:hypothetical protein
MPRFSRVDERPSRLIVSGGDAVWMCHALGGIHIDRAAPGKTLSVSSGAAPPVASNCSFERFPALRE